LPLEENSIIVAGVAIPAPAARSETARPQATGRDRGYHPLRIARVVRETADTASFVLDVPEDLRSAFRYEAGQFCSFRVVLDGREHMRCYSMSSSPAVDEELQVTVKRVPDGLVSNWMLDTLGSGDVIDTSVPSGLFRAGELAGDIVAFGAGSGITPIFSILKTVLAGSPRRARLLYANRDRASIIFAAELDRLSAEHPERLSVHHHLDVDHGFVDAGSVPPLLAGATDAEYLVCGPGPFMDVVERALLDHGVDTGRIHIERFTPTDHDPLADATGPEEPASTQVTIEIGGRVGTTEHHPGTTILQVARELGLSPPSSCEAGSCATCMAKLVQGEVSMRTNNALTPDEVADGWVLTCQSVPTSASVRVVYD
jgi:ferredoxin-NADP reductase